MPALRVDTRLDAIAPALWDGLLLRQAAPTPFMAHAYLHALAESGCASASTGWAPHYFSLWEGSALVAACALYIKTHSYGEYVFDWAWAQAYQRHGLAYYPKAVVSVPFTPVGGSRLLARSPALRHQLLGEVLRWCQGQGLSSLHLLLTDEADQASAQGWGLLAREQLQFHWHNAPKGFEDWDAFLATLSQDKRKKIRQEQRKVAQAGVRFAVYEGAAITPGLWDFFYRCYAHTYLEHGNPPYLSRDFFARVSLAGFNPWVLFVAERSGRPIASSLIATSLCQTSGIGSFDGSSGPPAQGAVAYGRYWGALEQVDCLHFEACYYQPLQWCIARGVARFEGGAQGEHKMARGLLPVATHSAHWLAHPAFAEAVERYLLAETEDVRAYHQALQARSPLRKAP